MIPQEKIIEESMVQSCKYRDDLLQEQRNPPIQRVGTFYSIGQINSMATGFLTGFEAGVRFAEAELELLAIKLLHYYRHKPFEATHGKSNEEILKMFYEEVGNK